MAKNLGFLAHLAIGIAVVMASSAGCASRRTLARPLSSADVQELHQTIGHGVAVVDYGAAQQPQSPPIRWRGNPHVTADGLWLKLQAPDSAEQIPAEQIPMETVRRIRVERSMPALVFGLLLGAVSGLAVGAAFETTPCMPSDSCLGLDFSGLTTAAGGIVGVVVGGVAGIVIGRGTTFTFPDSPKGGQ